MGESTGDEKRFVLGIAYQAGRNPLIKRGADGHRDFFSAEELERAAWQFMKSRESGVMHVDGTLGHADITESYIYRGPDWDVAGTIVKAGDWLIGARLDPVAWQAVKEGRLTGWSPQGGGRRVRPA